MNGSLALSLLLLLGLACWQDVGQRRIPNVIPVAIAVLWPAYALTQTAFPSLDAIAVALAVLAVGMAAWRLGLMGGGDVKLTAALSLWSGTEHTLPMLGVIALAGGALAVAMTAARRPLLPALLARYPFAAGASTRVGDLAGLRLGPAAPATLPYGVAVAAGGCWLVAQLFTA
jgi:prepilin peptidase CpaA